MNIVQAFDWAIVWFGTTIGIGLIALTIATSGNRNIGASGGGTIAIGALILGFIAMMFYTALQ